MSERSLRKSLIAISSIFVLGTKYFVVYGTNLLKCKDLFLLFGKRKTRHFLPLIILHYYKMRVW